MNSPSSGGPADTARPTIGNGGPDRPFDPRQAEIARLRKERDEWRARERATRAEVNQLHERLSLLSQASKRFADSMRSGMSERHYYRQRVGAQYAVSRVLVEARDLRDAAPDIMQIIGDRLGWEMGVLWMMSDNALRCESIWRSPAFPPGSFEEACQSASYVRGAGLPGRVWSMGEPVVTRDLIQEEDPLGEAATKAGLRGAIAFPVRDGVLAGVFELFRADELVPDDGLLATVALVGHQIGQFVERRRAEAERERALFREREARRELSNILESISDAFFAVDREWRFTYVNRRAEELWSRSRKNLLGKNLWEEFPRAAGSEQYEMIRRAMEERTTASFEAISPIAGVWVAGSAYPSASGGVAVHFNDVTEQRRAGEALRASEERLQRAIAIETVGVLFFNVSGQITEANDAFLRMSGYSREDIAEGLLRWDVMTPPEWMARSLEAVEELQTTGRTTPYEKEYLRKDGSRWWGLFAASLLAEEEAVEFVVDVTGRKRAEEERERLVAHELTARAQADERRRLSRELHDRVAHDMALVHQSLELHTALKESDPERAEAKMELAKATAKEALHSTRNLSMELRQPEVRHGLRAALSDLLRDVVPPAVDSTILVKGDEDLVPPELRNQLFVILREAVRNAVTHSGCANMTVGLDISPERVVGYVDDDGRGFDAAESRWGGGIRSMRERAALVGAKLEISAAPKGGTKVMVSIPLEQV